MIEVKNLSMDYPKSIGVQNVNLCFQSGEVVGLFGENGMGKTTLLKLLIGIYKPKKSGQILFDGKSLDYTLYNDIAYISEELSLFVEWTIDEHRGFYESAFEKFNLERFDKLLEFFDLNKEFAKVKTFSKGQKAKLELAIGFSKGAKYIFMDEPFLGNDALTRVDFLKVMAGLMNEEDTIIIASHMLNEIEQFIDRAVFIEFGKIKQDYLIDEVTEKGGLLEVAKEVFKYNSDKINNLI